MKTRGIKNNIQAQNGYVSGSVLNKGLLGCDVDQLFSSFILFRIVTSVIPAALAISSCVTFFSLTLKDDIYNS